MEMLVDVLVNSLSTGAFEETEQRRVLRLVGRLGVALYRLDARLVDSSDDDSVTMRIRNVAFVVVGVLVLTLSLVWFVVTMALGRIAGGIGVLCSALLTLLALLLVVYWRVLTPQQGSCVIIALLLVLPAAIHVVQGSLEASAGVLVWTTIGPLLASVLLRSRAAVAVVVALSFVSVALATLVAALTIGMWREVRERERFDGITQLVMYALNASTPALVVLSGLAYSDLRLAAEQRRSDALLNRIMPPRIAALMKAGALPQSIVERFESVTCFFSDIVGFTVLSEQHTPAVVIAMLNALCERMDAAAVECGVFKVATIGDAYFAVCGAPDALGAHDAATRMALFALAVRDLVARETARFGVQLRIGLHSGPVVAGVLGVLAPQFTLIGDTVNTASRMESYGAPGKVHCSAATRALLRGRFRFSARTPLTVKGKGVMQTYWLLGPREVSRGDGDGGDPTELASPSEAALRHLYLTRTAQPPSPPESADTKSVLHEAATVAANIRPLAMSTKKFVVRSEV